MSFKAGYVAIVGRPNVGKSTLINSILKEKIAIASPKPETTRDNIIGILTLKQSQIIFVDTPGYHLPKNLLGKTMVKKAQSSIMDTDLVLFMIEATKGFGLDEERFIDFLTASKKPHVFLIINKVDLVKKERLLPLMERAAQLYPFKEIIPLSARKITYIPRLIETLATYLPESEMLFPEDELTDKNERFHIQEVIREEIITATFEEVPHAVAVVIEEMRQGQKPRDHIAYIRACIFVEKDSQKKIIIGHNGQMIKIIGKNVRKEVQNFLGKKVFLDLWVKVLPNWRQDPVALKRLGYV